MAEEEFEAFGLLRLEAIEIRARIGVALDDVLGHYCETRSLHPEMAMVPFAVDSSLVSYMEGLRNVDLSLLFVGLMEEMYDRMDVSEREQRMREHVHSDEREEDHD